MPALAEQRTSTRRLRQGASAEEPGSIMLAKSAQSSLNSFEVPSLKKSFPLVALSQECA